MSAKKKNSINTAADGGNPDFRAGRQTSAAQFFSHYYYYNNITLVCLLFTRGSYAYCNMVIIGARDLLEFARFKKKIAK